MWGTASSSSVMLQQFCGFSNTASSFLSLLMKSFQCKSENGPAESCVCTLFHDCRNQTVTGCHRCVTFRSDQVSVRACLVTRLPGHDTGSFSSKPVCLNNLDILSAVYPERNEAEGFIFFSVSQTGTRDRYKFQFCSEKI